MAERYEIIQLGKTRTYQSRFGDMYANAVVVAGPKGEEEAEISTKKPGVLKVGDTFEAEREETQYGLKLKRKPPPQYTGNGGGSSAPAQRQERPAKPTRTYAEVLGAYRTFLADTGQTQHATTLLLSWMRGEFTFEPPTDPDGPPRFE